MKSHTFYVGTCFGDEDSPTRTILQLSLTNGQLSNVGKTSTDGINPGWIVCATTKTPFETDGGSCDSSSSRFVYVVMEDDPGFVRVYEVESTNDSLSPLNVDTNMFTSGTAPCYASLDATRRWMFAAHYTSGTISVLSISGGPNENGSKTETQTIQFRPTDRHPLLPALADRQEAPHAHCIIPHPSNRWVVACDLGLSAVFCFSFNDQTGLLEGDMDDERHYRGDPNDGCRHCCWNKDGTVLYVTNELSCTVTALSFHSDTGKLGERRVTVPINGVNLDRRHHQGLSDLMLHPNGKLLFVGCRSTQPSGCIAVFAVNEQSDDGTNQFVELELQGFAATLGEVPRNFKLIVEDTDHPDEQPMWLVVGNQESKSVECFQVCANGDGGDDNDGNDGDVSNQWSNSLPVTRYLRHTSGISTAPYKPCNIASFDALYA